MPPSKKMQLMLSKCNIFFLCLGSVLIAVGLTTITVFSALHIHDDIITSALRLAPGSQAFQAWQKPKTPITMNIYFYNWTNPEDIYKPGTKPKFVEMGPYRYMQIKEKTNITWNSENQTITYRYLKHFYFDEENSPNHHSDVITTINMVALTAAHRARDWNAILQHTIIRASLSSVKLHVQKTVRELLFEGYEDPIITTKNMIPFVSDDVDRFGWFYGRNGTIGTDGVYNMVTTPDGSYGTLKNWNYDNKTPFYDEQCSGVSGSGGELYPRNLQPTRISLFSPEMCRTAQFNFEKEVDVKGITCYKYAPGVEVFDNGSTIEENVCYCNGKCQPSGILNVSSCREDAPVYLSLPHFYKADSSYLDAVEGLNPIKNKHELYFSLEPRTGIIADVAARMQVNVLLQPHVYPLFDDVPEIMFPVFWFDQQVVMTDELASGLTLLFNLPNIISFVCIFVIVLGLLGVLGVILYATCHKQKKIRQRKLTKEEIPLKSKS